MIDVYTRNNTFDYEPPRMEYDRKTGEIKILEKLDDQKKKPKKIIKNLDQFNAEKSRLLKELGIGEDGRALDDSDTVDTYATKLQSLNKRIKEEFDIDPSGFYVFS